MIVSRTRSAEDESAREGIVRGEHELGAAGDPGAAFDLGHDAAMRTERRLAHGAPGEARADDALDDALLAEREAAASVFERDASGDARARRRAIDFARGEDAHVLRVRAGGARRPGEDRPVEEGELVLEWMPDLASVHDRPLDPHARVDQIAVAAWRDLEPEPRCVDVGVERAAERDVVA